MGHNVEYIVNLLDHVSDPLRRITSSFQTSNTGLNKFKTNLASVKSSASGFDKLKNSVDRMPSSIEALREKLKQLNAQLETTTHKTTFQNLRKEIAATQKQLNTMTGGPVAGGLGSMLKSAMAYLGPIIVARAAIGFVKGSVEAYDQDAKNRAQLRAGLLSTNFASGKTEEGLLKQALSLEEKTLFKHADTEKAQSILMTFSKVRGTIYDQAIPAIQDMSTRMGGDLVSNTRLLGKALEDPARGMMFLRRVGIQFGASQEKVIKNLVAHGKLYEAQQLILAKMTEKFGGSAEAAAKAGIGPTQQLANKWLTLKEILGERLAPGINKAAGDLSKFVGTLKNWIEVPVEEKVNKEISQIRLLQSRLADANLKEADRAKYLRELTDINPELTKGIDNEAFSYKKLSDNIDGVVSSLKEKIILDRASKKIDKELSTYTDYQDKIAAFQEMAGGITSKYNISGGTYEQNVQRTLDKLRPAFEKFKKEHHDIISTPPTEFSDPQAFDYARLSSTIPQINILNTKSKAQDAVINKINNETNKLLKSLGYSDKPGGSILTNKPGPGSGPGGDDLGKEIDGISGGGSKATNITINLPKGLASDIKITSATLKEGVSEIRDIITEQLLKVLNSANRIATQ